MMDQPPQAREINLYDIWTIIVKRKRLIIGLCSIAVTFSAVISFFLPKLYRGEVVLNILQDDSLPRMAERGATAKEIISAKEISEIIGNVDREKRTKIFSHTYPSVNDVKVKVLKDSQDKIGVTIEARNVDEIPEALSELIGFINNFDLIKLTVKEVRERLEKRSVELSNIVGSSSDLSLTYRKLLKGGKLLPMGFNPVDLDKRIADVKLEKLTVDQSMQKVNEGGVRLATQLYVSSKPVKPNIALNVSLAGILSLLAGIFLAFSLEYIEKVKNAG